MENASKALIIAGAILLSILLITLGIIVYRQAAGVMDNNAMDETAVSTFNEKFQQYEGDNVRGTQINSLLNTVVQNNLSNSNDKSKQVIIKTSNCTKDTNWIGTPPGDATVTQLAITSSATNTPVTGKATTGKSYKVECTADDKSGYIKEIKITGI